MATAQTTRSRSAVTARTRAQADDSRLERISHTLESAQQDLAQIGGTVGTGVKDLRRDVDRLLRDARRDLTKMRRAIQRDVTRLQKDLVPSASKPARSSRSKVAAGKA